MKYNTELLFCGNRLCSKKISTLSSIRPYGWFEGKRMGGSGYYITQGYFCSENCAKKLNLDKIEKIKLNYYAIYKTIFCSENIHNNDSFIWLLYKYGIDKCL